jgi:murein DD-endopeptidase MepM/ murein hydrolase activator NlpD
VGRLAGAAVAGFLVLLVACVAGVGAVVTSLAAGRAPDTGCTLTGATTGPATAPAGLSVAQTRNAAVIVAVGKGMAVPAYGWVVAIATALQESGLINRTTATDHDSLGLFQQRPSQGWGTPAQVTDPVYASRAFYRRLLAVPGWQTMTETRAAQAVQRSTYPDAYAPHEAQAHAIVAALTGVTAAVCTPATAGTSRWVRPTSGPVTSGFRTPDRSDHDGVDLAPPRATVVVAASAGLVTTATCDPTTGDCDRDGSLSTAGCGWYVEIRHPGNLTTRYCHLGHRPTVRVGQNVAAGTPIGVVGMSGNATGPHCHFETHTGYPATPGNATDPIAFMAARGVTI